LICHIILHIYSTILLIFYQFLQKLIKTALKASKHSKRSGGDIITVHIISIEQVQTSSDRFLASNILVQRRRRNGIETWRRPSFQREHLRLKYTWGNFTELWRSATERKSDI
jgi:hypothetical protein